MLGIFFLMLIISASLGAVITIWNNVNQYEAQEMDRLGYGALTAWVYGKEDLTPLKQQILDLKDVGALKEQKSVYTTYEVNGIRSASTGMAVLYDPSQYDYHLFLDNLSGLKSDPKAPPKGQVYVPPSFASLFHARIGDTVKIILNTKAESVSYTIAGFFEDPFMGSAMTGMKTILFQKEDYQWLSSQPKAQGKDAKVALVSMFHIFQAKDSRLTPGELQNEINNKTEIAKYSDMSYLRSTMLGFMLIIQNIFVGFLLAFIAVLFIATIIIVGHSIRSSLEHEYVNIGILKAVGFHNRQFRYVHILQYLLTIVAGMLLGIPFSYLIVRIVNRITITTSSLLVPSGIPIGIWVMLMLGILVLMVGYILLKTGKIVKVTPIRAIRGGAEDVYFQGHGTMPVFRKGMHFWIALRQLVTGRKYYISAGIITVVLVFFMSLVGRIGSMIGADGEGLIASFETTSYDFAIASSDAKVMEQADALIKKNAQVELVFGVSMISGITINNTDCTLNVLSDPEQYRILKGDTCKNANEILVTEFIAKDLGLHIGDRVTLKGYKGTAEYIISGFNQCANDMGSNMSLSLEGYRRLSPGYQSRMTAYRLADHSQKDTILTLLKDSYKKQLLFDENTWSGIRGVASAMKSLELFMYVIVVIFIIIVIGMTGGRILYKEQRDLGIYKSLGFHTRILRVTFAYRFLLVAVAGSVLGIVLSGVCTDPLVTQMLHICGISRFESHPGIVEMLLPGALVSLFFFLFAYLASGKIKHSDPAVLIVE